MMPAQHDAMAYVHAWTLGTPSKLCYLTEPISQIDAGPAPSTDLCRPLLQIQHQNEINDAFFLADALTKRWLMS